jgi:putative NADH-flavin reductase
MAGDKILVLGATGPAGICLLRELLHRRHAIIAYVRNASKIPQDLASNTLLEVLSANSFSILDSLAPLSPSFAKSILTALQDHKRRDG